MYKPKRVTIVFVAVLFALLMWPLLTIFSRIEPRVFGLPFCVFWPLLILLILLAGMILLDHTVEKEE